uniref:Uncharacterized protein n=1 Tax=Cajanus cajan TaxID=3821 RepID=A0A151RVB3_CAJCA|nr:hypothetical protein KK1_031926 [Cajanus cajan]
MMKIVVGKNLFEGYKVGDKKIDVNLLHYVDDKVFLDEVSLDNVAIIKCLL